MENQENLKNEDVEVMENALVEMEEKNTITSFANRKRNRQSSCDTITNIQDKKKLYNLSTSVDCMLNDCIGEKIRVKGIVIKFYEKPLKEPIINEETGEIKDTERKVSCVLVDDIGKSYATGSFAFVYQLLNFIDGGYTTEEEIASEGLEIEIIKKNVQNSPNKALGFKLV